MKGSRFEMRGLAAGQYLVRLEHTDQGSGVRFLGSAKVALIEGSTADVTIRLSASRTR